VDDFQGGAGTSTNMNEVIANRAIEFLGGIKATIDIPAIGMMNKIEQFPIDSLEMERFKKQLGMENRVMVSALTERELKECTASLNSLICRRRSTLCMVQ